MTWRPIWALPNIDLDEPVESDAFAFVPPSDPRVRGLEREHPNFKIFMRQFRDTHGVRFKPALIICQSDVAEQTRTVDTVASFRDLLVASTVPLARSLSVYYDNNPGRVIYSNYFWAFPWMVDQRYTSVVANMPAMWAAHGARNLRGHSSPDLLRTELHRRDFDEPLLQELLRRWAARYKTDDPYWKDIALFRSLNMVNQACLTPAGKDTVIHDYGRMSGLWVAAFEILVHPGGSEYVNKSKVFDLLQEIPWIVKRHGYRRYKVKAGKNHFERKNLACWLYSYLYSCRNDFMHGNPVGLKNLLLPKSGREITFLAAILYRLALSSFLNPEWKKAAAPLGPQDLANLDAYAKSYERKQADHEEALELIRISPEELHRAREIRRNNARQRVRRRQ